MQSLPLSAKIRNFNTSHVTVYRRKNFEIRHKKLYFNTSHVTVYRLLYFFLLKIFNHFNTSHVTVYPLVRSDKTPARTFQYIPCYGLSRRFYSFRKFYKLFQYIPCYGLSGKLRVDLTDHMDFNTSHVTVYPATKQFYIFIIIISIHPMLRFIFFRSSMIKIKVKFQYIPCYGLSNDFKPFLSWHLSSFPLFYVISTFFTSRL